METICDIHDKYVNYYWLEAFNVSFSICVHKFIQYAYLLKTNILRGEKCMSAYIQSTHMCTRQSIMIYVYICNVYSSTYVTSTFWNKFDDEFELAKPHLCTWGFNWTPISRLIQTLIIPGLERDNTTLVPIPPII